MLFLLQEVRKDSRPVLGLLVLVLPLLLPFELESGAEGIEPVASMFVSDFVADEPDGPEMYMVLNSSIGSLMELFT